MAYPLIVHVCPQPQVQVSGLNKEEACKDSAKKVYEWIHSQGEEVQILRGGRLVRFFSDGPHDKSLGQVDMGLLPLDSASSRPGLYLFL